VSLGTIPGDEKTNGETNNTKCNDTRPENLNDMKKTVITASTFCKTHTKSDSSYGFITLLKLESELLSQVSVDSLLPKITGILSKEIH